jgi:ABC-2 type transport system ATP-binding protein
MEMPAASEPVISVRNLSKRYGAVYALSDACITVPRGKVYGFLGPNGAGKTTTIRLLMGFIKPTSGSAQMFGHDCWNDGLNARRDLGFLVTADALYSDMSGVAQLDYAAKLSRRPAVLRDQLLDALELSRDVLQRKLGSYSKGMRQKLALIAAMQHDPELLILDEPTDGLDPLIQRNFEQFLLGLRDQGRTIFMSSHDLAEVERICDTVAVIRAGQIVAEESIVDLLRRHSRHVSILFSTAIPENLEEVAGLTLNSIEGRRAELLLSGNPNELLHFLSLHDVEEIEIIPPNLEDIFMSYYGASSTETPSVVTK